MSDSSNIDEYYDVIIVGAGPAGIGVSILLQKLEINHIILEKASIGDSFRKWPKETRFISPSFTGNFFKMPDLNAITPGTSPAFTLLTEHPTGEDYVEYLENLAKYYDLPIKTEVCVDAVRKKGDSFVLTTTHGVYKSTYAIWAAGEYQYPNKQAFEGAHLCTHYSEIDSFSDLDGDEHIVIGAYESGFDAMVNLIRARKIVTLLDDSDYLNLVKSDSSYSLAPFTRDRVEYVTDLFDYYTETKVTRVEFVNATYIVKTANGHTFTSPQKPINCTGFASSLTLVQESFGFKNNYPLLNEFDESTKTKNLFLVGPQVKHGNALFCFIYKYRQRFAIVAEKIAKRMKVPPKTIEKALQEYKNNNFYLDNLSCCDDECVC
ncbi:NAD(P)/FAD-dependent oxidoreductase [Microscilla marina]|uniref:NAD-binding site protein n=1 Tax=Microscilla marina ATCC 23134 TaxID=313606 RepID=A1ZQZ4_MICM2|nr:NAD(P)/FAD-dependent oxidoreductase [Microscilla marina]EAY27299.1 NAD-binding site protein [Microscilla marina ATCC 23134]